MPKFDMPKTGTWEERGGWVVRRLMTDLRLTAEQAAGLVGNWGYESRGFTALQEEKPMIAGSRGGAGWGMWTASRRLAFEDYARKRSLSINSDEANYGFAVAELKSTQANFLSRLRNATTLAEACRCGHEFYERSSDVIDGSFRSGPERLKWAQRALAGAQGIIAAPNAPNIADVDSDIADAVKRAQAALAKRGLYPADAIDGIPGPMTRTALQQWQAGRTK